MYRPALSPECLPGPQHDDSRVVYPMYTVNVALPASARYDYHHRYSARYLVSRTVALPHGGRLQRLWAMPMLHTRTAISSVIAVLGFSSLTCEKSHRNNIIQLLYRTLCTACLPADSGNVGAPTPPLRQPRRMTTLKIPSLWCSGPWLE
jgi:hypothetical protein